MAGTNYKISELPAVTTLDGNNILPVVDLVASTTKKATVQQVLNFVTSSTINNLSVTAGSFLNLNSTNLTASNATITILSASVISASSYVNLPNLPAGGTNGSIQYNVGGFNTGDSSKLVLDYTNNFLGVGVNPPLARFHAKASSGETARLETSVLRGNGANYLSFHDPVGRKGYIGYGGTTNDHLNISNAVGNADITLLASGSDGNLERMRITSAGRVGIGTSSPATALQVIGEARATNFSDNNGAYNVNLGSNNLEGRGLVVGYSGGGYGGIGYNVRHTTIGSTYISPQADTSNYIQFSQGFQFLGDAGTTAGRTTSFTELMRITNTGRVGIGTTNPSSKLHVSGASGLTIETVNTIWADIGADVSTGNYLKLRRPATTNALGYIGGGGGGAISAGSQNDLAIRSEGELHLATGNSPRVTITSAGNVGIGTSSPGDALHVQGGEIRVQGTNAVPSEGSGLILGDNNSGGYKYIQSFDIQPLQINPLGNNVSFPASFVGIGTSSPSFQLQLSSDSAAKPSTNTWTISSDIRIKENVQNYVKGLETLIQINPVTYDYNGKAGFNSAIKNNIGLIAQDVKDILPESISTYKTKLNLEDTEDTELYNFNSHALTYIMINSIKQLLEQVNVLKTEIQTLKSGSI